MEGPYQYAAAHEREERFPALDTARERARVADITSAKCLIRSRGYRVGFGSPWAWHHAPL